MRYDQLFRQIITKQSFLCIGLDPEYDKLPPHLYNYANPVLEFHKAIIEATHDLCVAFKPNLAFFEAMGTQGWSVLAQTMQHIPADTFTIADAKRGDIGNTSRLYARAFFEQFSFDAVTVAPYMGEDSVAPFLGFPDKWVILLALTSNTGSRDFQFTPQENDEPLFEKVIRKSSAWGSADNMMYVVGATHPEQLGNIRKIIPNHFLLVPGLGAQGGDLASICRYGMNSRVGLLVNASRAILYAGNGKDFAEKAREVALQYQQEMAPFLVGLTGVSPGI
jgi:orotidine-5'-phosphate decarboxylase